MNFLNLYLKNTLKYDLISQFNYKSINYIPNLKKIVLCFSYKVPTYRQILSSLMALELISNTKPKLVTLNKSNVVLKLRAGSPVGCKVTLTKLKMLDFISVLFFVLIPKDKQLKISLNKKEKITNSLSLNFKSLHLFDELKDHYNLLKNINNLSIILVTSSKSFFEFLFILKILKVKF